MSDKREKLARIIEATLTRERGRTTTVHIDEDDYAYVRFKDDEDDYYVRFAVPPEAYDALAVSEEHGGVAFSTTLLPPSLLE